MLEYLLFAVALVGAAAGGWIDLKTTEVPDSVPLGMAVAGLVIHAFQAYSTGTLFPLYSAAAVSLGYLAFGYILYYTGQWGEADVLLLGAVGFVLPTAPQFFSGTAAALPWTIYPLIFLLNTFIVGGVYSILYAFAVALGSGKVKKAFYEDITKNRQTIIRIALFAIFGVALMSLYFGSATTYPASFFLIQAAIILPAFAGLYLIYRFAIIVDKHAFRKKIPASQLREGDVLAESIRAGGLNLSGKLFVGLEKSDVKKIQKVKKSVLIKEGIRYGPTFFLALLATWLFGNLLMVVLN